MVITMSASSTRQTASASGGLWSAKNAGVQHADRREQPVRRRAGRRDQRQVPGARGARDDRAVGSNDQQAKSDEPDQGKPWRDRRGGSRIGTPFVGIGILEDTTLSNRH